MTNLINYHLLKDTQNLKKKNNNLLILLTENRNVAKMSIYSFHNVSK